MNCLDETHLLLCNKEDLVKYILELKDRSEWTECSVQEIVKENEMLKDRRCQRQNALININSQFLEFLYGFDRDQEDDDPLPMTNKELKDYGYEEENETERFEFGIHTWVDKLLKENKLLKKENEMLKDRSQDAMKLTIAQNEKFMDELERNDRLIECRGEEIAKCHTDIINLREECDRYPENSAGYDEEEFEEMVNVMDDITEHPDYDDMAADISELERLGELESIIWSEFYKEEEWVDDTKGYILIRDFEDHHKMKEENKMLKEKISEFWLGTSDEEDEGDLGDCLELPDNHPAVIRSICKDLVNTIIENAIANVP